MKYIISSLATVVIPKWPSKEDNEENYENNYKCDCQTQSAIS